MTLISPDGAYGGPARVALNQSVELIRRGYNTIITAGTRGYTVAPKTVDDVPVRLFTARTLVPGTGFAGLGAPGLGRWFRSHRAEFDVVHIHLGRDLVVLPLAVAARRYGIPYALQTHGMVAPSSRPLAAPLDAVWTHKVLRGAGAVFYLTPAEREQLVAVGGESLRLTQLGNGVPHYSRDAVDCGTPEVLFAARMHPRKRPTAFVEMARLLLDNGVDARFTLVGPDEGEGTALRRSIGADPRIVWEGALDSAAVPRRMAGASVYVLPSVREPYPMSVLEAMAVGVPVVVSNDCGLAPTVSRTGSGIVTNPTAPALAAAVGTLLGDRSRALEMGRRGRSTVRTEFGMAVIADRLLATYTDLVEAVS
ncbi:glycosyltransferase [Rhodococcus sp. NPDC127528]|uniref:glycosyltransferase n=1 Tax=unclassified Rhodococcus (in: high G+C Gram-positive bacteria) TaxID=192944 RepID=UPI003641D0E3